ncbi:hypothetical protein ACS0TY_012581 [Phlomoides rotata]
MIPAALSSLISHSHRDSPPLPFVFAALRLPLPLVVAALRLPPVGAHRRHYGSRSENLQAFEHLEINSGLGL